MDRTGPDRKAAALQSLAVILIISSACQQGFTPAATPKPPAAVATPGILASPLRTGGPPPATSTPAGDSAAPAGRPGRNAAGRTLIGTEESSLVLEGGGIRTYGPGVEPASQVAGGPAATISARGTYRVAGELADGQIAVDAKDGGTVTLVLDGATLRNADGPAIDVVNAGEVVIILADGTQNALSGGAAHAAIAGARATIRGGGSLAVAGRLFDGPAGSEGLVVESGTVTVDGGGGGRENHRAYP